MKKIFFIIALCFMGYGAFAQTDNRTTTPDPNAPAQTYRHPNGYVLKDGRMMMVKDGNMTLIQKDMTLSNGTVIMPNGYYMEKGKAKMMLKDGQYIATDGSLGTSSMNNSAASPTKSK